MDEIELFDDDPKGKLLRRFREAGHGRVSDLFHGLFSRTDFVRGGLLFAHCAAADGIGKPAPDLSRMQHVADGSRSRVDDMLTCLRGGDFSSLQSAMAATAQFTGLFGIEVEYSMSSDTSSSAPHPDRVGDGEPPRVVAPRRLH